MGGWRAADAIEVGLAGRKNELGTQQRSTDCTAVLDQMPRIYRDVMLAVLEPHGAVGYMQYSVDIRRVAAICLYDLG